MNAIFDKTINKLTDIISYRNKKHDVLLSNVTNMDTDGYRATDVEFNAEMKAASARLARTDSRHLESGKGGELFTVVQSEDKVNLDKSMTNLAENHLMHNTAVEMLARKFKTLQTVLKESR